MNQGRVLVVALFALVGCAAEQSNQTPLDDSEPAGGDEVRSSRSVATSEGTIDSEDAKLREAAADSLLRSEEDGKVTGAAMTIELSSGTGMCSAFLKNANHLRMFVQSNAGELEPGSVYKVGTNEDSDHFVRAEYGSSNGKCEGKGEKVYATSGTVTILSASQQKVKGEYDLRFGRAGHVKGTFEGPTCLKKLWYDTAPVVCK